MNRPEAPGVVVNDVTRLNPVRVWAVAAPTSVAEVQETVRRAEGPISIGGGHFSMGGQTASPGSLHLDPASVRIHATKTVATQPAKRPRGFDRKTKKGTSDHLPVTAILNY